MALTIPLGASQADLDEVEGLVRKAGTSFYRGMRVLPPDRRHAIERSALRRAVDRLRPSCAKILEEMRKRLFARPQKNRIRVRRCLSRQ